MKAIRDAVKRLLRGPRVSGLLASLGIDARRFWLLMDLFDQLSDRGEMLDQLGRNGVALKSMTWMYAGISALMSFVMVATHRSLAGYCWFFLITTGFLMLIVLLLETGNSLVNPEEGLVLAHQPVNGATYTAAKLTHLTRIVFFLAVGMNGIPAFLGLLLKGVNWSYPLFHLALALGVGLVAALLCCALYGWLMRLVPTRRLKAVAQFAGIIPFLLVVSRNHIQDWLAGSPALVWLQHQTAMRPVFGVAVGAGVIASVVFGIRSLSADYLIRVSSMMHSGSARRGSTRRSPAGGFVARWCGGPPARAGFAFVCQMTRRDFQFRRQVLPMVLVVFISGAPMLFSGWRTDPFSGRFTVLHLLPHLLGFVLFMICNLLAYGSDFKGAWIFLLAPAAAFGGFARGIWAALFLRGIVVPYGITFFLLAWSWGVPHAGLFVAYSAVLSSTYLALELRLIEGAPFSSQVDATRGAEMLPIMAAGGIAMAIAVGVQFFLVFRSPVIVVAATVLLGAAACILTRWSMQALADSIRWSLGLISAESGTLYKEVDMGS
jgi:hypothetical protein